MARPILQIKGLDKFKKDVKKAGKTVEDRLDIELQDSRNRIRNGAKSRAPEYNVGKDKKKLKKAYQGLLKTNWEVGGERLNYTVFNSQNYAAYVEFGTGQFAAKTVAPYDKDWQDHAMEFYKNGEGKMPATPMLYPAVKEEEMKLPKILEDAIQDELNGI